MNLDLPYFKAPSLCPMGTSLGSQCYFQLAQVSADNKGRCVKNFLKMERNRVIVLMTGNESDVAGKGA